MTNPIDQFLQKKEDESPFLKLTPGEGFTGKFKGGVMKVNKFGNDIISYSFIDKESGLRKTWDNGNISVAKAFRQVKEDEDVTIECSESDRKDPQGIPYKDYKIFQNGKNLSE